MAENKKEKASDVYEYAFKLTLHAGEVLWNSSNAFLLANTILVAVIAGIIQKNGDNYLLLLVVSIIGVAVSLIWFLSYRRRSDYYKFHMAQAKAAEPENWKLLRDVGEKFSNGEIVHVGNSHYQLGFFSRIRTNGLMTTFILIFLIAYVSLCVFSTIVFFKL